VFRFALTENACFDALSVKKGEEVIVCAVKEKEEAKEEYKQAVEQGKTDKCVCVCFKPKWLRLILIA